VLFPEPIKPVRTMRLGGVWRELIKAHSLKCGKHACVTEQSLLAAYNLTGLELPILPFWHCIDRTINVVRKSLR
jgi:hypothetical protein